MRSVKSFYRKNPLLILGPIWMFFVIFGFVCIYSFNMSIVEGNGPITFIQSVIGYVGIFLFIVASIISLAYIMLHPVVLKACNKCKNKKKKKRKTFFYLVLCSTKALTTRVMIIDITAMIKMMLR